MSASLEIYVVGHSDYWPCVVENNKEIWYFLGFPTQNSAIKPVAELRGLPTDCPVDLIQDWQDASCPYYPSWVTLQELLDYDYDEVIQDKRPDIYNTGGRASVREMLGEHFFELIEYLKRRQETQLVFWWNG